MQIYVKTTDNKTFTLDVEPHDTVDTVKEKVLKASGIPPEMQRLTFDTRKLDDGSNTLT